MDDYSTKLEDWLQHAEELAQDEGARYLSLTLVYRQNGGAPEPFCALADWPRTRPGRLATLEQENARLRAEIEGMRAAQQPHVCPDCGRGFANQHALDVHKGLCPGRAEPRAWEAACPHCGQVVGAGARLQEHIRQAHGDVAPPTEIDPTPDEHGRVPCPECHAPFGVGSAMAAHRQKIHGVKGPNIGHPYHPKRKYATTTPRTCQYCGGEYTTGSIKKHERSCPQRPPDPPNGDPQADEPVAEPPPPEADPPGDAPRPETDRRQRLAQAQQRVMELEKEQRRLIWKKDADSKAMLAEVERQLNDARAAYRAAQSGGVGVAA